MITDTQNGRELLNEVAYAIVARQAPSELPLFVSVRDRYLSDPDKYLEPPSVEDEVLGIGAATAVVTFSQVVFPVLAPMLTLLVNEVLKTLGESIGTGAVEWIKKRWVGQTPEEGPDFTDAQLARLRVKLDHIAEHEAQRLGLEPNTVRLVRDAVIAGLVSGN